MKDESLRAGSPEVRALLLELVPSLRSVARPTPRSTAPSIISKRRAAELLGVSGRTVQRYVARGLVTPHAVGLRWGVRAADVERAKREGVPRARPGDRISKLLLAQQMAELSVQTKLMMTILDLRYQPLGLGDRELASLADSASHAGEHGWLPGSERRWLEILIRLDEKDFRALERGGTAWSGYGPFMSLALGLVKHFDPIAGSGVETSGSAPRHPWTTEDFITRGLVRYVVERLRGLAVSLAVRRGANRKLRRLLKEYTAGGHRPSSIGVEPMDDCEGDRPASHEENRDVS